MWIFLGLLVLCSLVGPLQGGPKGPSHGIVSIISSGMAHKYVSSVFLREELLQIHLLGIQFPDVSHKDQHPENWIKELHVVRVLTPSVTLELHEKGDSLLCIKARFHLSGKFFFGKHFERVDIIVDVDLKAEVRLEDYFAGVFHIRMQVCKSEFIIARITCPSHLLVKKVRPIVTTILTASFHKTLCRVVEMVIGVGRVDFLHTANVFFSVGTVATMQYQLACMPLITSSYAVLEFNMIIRTGGRVITLPVGTGPVTLPALHHHGFCLGMSQASLDAILMVLLQIRVQEFISTPEVFSGASELTTVVASLLSHQKCPKCPLKAPLKITISLVGIRRIILEPKRAVLQLSVEIALLAKGPSGSLVGLFVLRANLKLSVHASVVGGRLFFTTKLTSLELLLVSSQVGPVDVSVLVELIKLLVQETFVPQVNECLDVGIPLPPVVHIHWNYPVIHCTQGMLVLCV
ncbi:BPI fold-containing family B member 4-like [Zootoca vivipara]|uniref:BPI fold-containing family B member 4-like n=1 Tax=Zootoca vivipara TaxID=8524 RepID=UPI00293BB61F|nr:BPI fold-containing family B member 4-like [Zootoca vivipara]XP_060133385.1 BPI fold-containing family B member 4-like [Zootoca vivipara]